ncbi:MAG: hypothetical protein AMJ79_09370 [Phycisphaerae bacterium SM23_30]|nr:MAG: hypothetical protein AMJ79_09370 [Phycisphaerae bacterium SM23_30]
MIQFNLVKFIRSLIRFYQLALSPYLPHWCRFQPTCSHYALEALRRHGLFKGLFLTACRILRCHPFCRGGYDPVP